MSDELASAGQLSPERKAKALEAARSWGFDPARRVVPDAEPDDGKGYLRAQMWRILDRCDRMEIALSDAENLAAAVLAMDAEVPAHEWTPKRREAHEAAHRLLLAAMEATRVRRA